MYDKFQNGTVSTVTVDVKFNTISKYKKIEKNIILILQNFYVPQIGFFDMKQTYLILLQIFCILLN